MTTRKIDATYDYKDADGELVFQVVRYEPKDFSQCKPTSGGGFVASVKNCPIIPYRLPELLEAKPNAVVFVVEGEKDVDRLAKLGIVATCNAGGAGKWKSDHARLLAARDVVIIPDNDDAGRKHAEKVARTLDGLVRSTKVVELPDLPKAGDVSDWLDAGGSKASLLKLVRAAPTWTAPEDADGEAKPSGGPGGGNRATQLVGLAESVKFFRDRLDCAYSQYPVSKHWEVAAVRSTEFRNWLQRQYYDRYGEAVPSQSINDALGTLEARAQFSSDCQDTYVRVAGLDGRVYIDLADEGWRIVEIDDEGWRIINDSPVRFRRPRAMLPLPIPIHGGSISELQEFVNIDSAHWPLYVGALVAALWPTGPYPLMAFIGEKGRAKSTTSRATRELIDPNSAPLRSFPHGERDFVIGAAQRVGFGVRQRVRLITGAERFAVPNFDRKRIFYPGPLPQ